MSSRGPLQVLAIVFLGMCLAFIVPVQTAQAQKQRSEQHSSGLTASQAAAKAKARVGGKVLKITPVSGGFKVKLLKKNGHVVSVTIRD